MKAFNKLLLFACSLLFLSCSAGEEGFVIRGTKGFDWTPEQCLEEIPVLKQYGMNFFAPCYLSFFSEHDRDISSLNELSGYNEWWIPFNQADLQRWGAVVKACRMAGIAFCFGMNPMLYSPRPLSVGSEEDYSILLEKYRLFQDMGAKWFYLALDDLELEGQAEIASGHFTFTNRLYHDLKKQDPGCNLVFCPTWYRGRDLDNPSRRPYLEAMGEMLDPEILVFWTGEKTVSPTVTVEDVLKYKNVVKHRMIFWDNYPVNDFNNTLFLGPLTGRDANICTELYGMMSNPLRDHRMNRLPLSTIADYMNSPGTYDELKAMQHALERFCHDEESRQMFGRLSEMYSSNFAEGQSNTYYNAAREKFSLAFTAGQTTARGYLDELKELSVWLDERFPDAFGFSKKVIANDIEWMQNQL